MVSLTLVAAVVAAASLVQGDIYYGKITQMGCYHSSIGLTYNDTATFQSSGHCQKRCVPVNKAVMATTAGQNCWCGDTMPPANAKVDDSNCAVQCDGYPDDTCGSADGTYFTVWNSGIQALVLNYGASTSVLSDSSSTTSSASTAVVTVEGQTHTITAAATAKSLGGSSGVNKAGVAAGVVVGVLAIASITGAAFFFLRRKQRREMEDEMKRQAAISNFIQAGKPGSSGGMSSTDSRLDPTIMTRRQSDGSIADNQDYSRRILKVTNA